MGHPAKIALLCATLAWTGSALAQSTDTAIAEALYRQGRSLMDEKKYDEACTKFAESQRLDPATGTLLNLASCNEARGKYATAWLQFSEALLAARRDQREDRVAFARERVAAIEPKISRLTVTVAPSAEVDGLEVRLDGAPLGSAARGVPTPLDPGPHELEASAPGKKPWTKEVVIGAEADQQTIAIPPLEDAPVVAPPDEPGGSSGPTPGSPDRVVTERPVPASVYVLGGATVLLAIGAGVTGAMYLDDKATYNELNTDPNASVADREAARDDAQLWLVTNGMLTAGAVIGAVFTGYLYFSRPEVKKRQAIVTPWIGHRSGGIAVSGTLF